MDVNQVECLHVPPIRPVSLEFGDSSPGSGALTKTVTIMNTAPGVKYIDLEEHNSLTRRKDSTDILQSECDHNQPSSPSKKHLLGGKAYPFAVVLRLRVLQIVCGISALVMGTVAFIEERGQFNLGVGILAGLSTVIAAASCIHTSRGFSGYRSPSCDYPWLHFRFLGPTIKAAAILSGLWTLVLLLHAALLLFASEVLVKFSSSSVGASAGPSGEIGSARSASINFDSVNDASAPNTNILILAIVLSALSGIILITVALILRIDCRYDPD